jgi:hypothetical protein
MLRGSQMPMSEIRPAIVRAVYAPREKPKQNTWSPGLQLSTTKL